MVIHLAYNEYWVTRTNRDYEGPLAKKDWKTHWLPICSTGGLVVFSVVVVVNDPAVAACLFSFRVHHDGIYSSLLTTSPFYHSSR